MVVSAARRENTGKRNRRIVDQSDHGDCNAAETSDDEFGLDTVTDVYDRAVLDEVVAGVATLPARRRTVRSPSRPFPIEPDRVEPGRVEPARVEPSLPRLTRHRGGTYSPTVQTIVLADGTRVRTDLIRLNPTIDTYSVDFDGHASPHSVVYRPVSWRHAGSLRARFRADEIGAIVASSYPSVDLGDLSDRVRRAGFALGHANLREHQAIAATQAALWKLTNDLDLDIRDLAVPSRSVPADTAGVLAPAELAAVEFTQPRQLAGFSFEASSRGPVDVVLQASTDGRNWRPVSGSRMRVHHDGTVVRRLAPLATVCSAGPASVSGYRHYRLVAQEDSMPISVTGLRFDIAGAPRYVNDEAVVHLYRYLLESVLDDDAARDTGARRARLLLAADRTLTPLVIAG